MATAKGRTGWHRDPVYWCMLVAMVLAVGSSVALRLTVRIAGPSAARAAELADEEVGEASRATKAAGAAVPR